MIVIIFAVLFVCSIFLLKRRREQLRRFRFRNVKSGDTAGTTRSSRCKNISDRYSNDKVPKNLDAIVIGSGVGGLATAAALAKFGWRVLVLEQHDVAGGSTHTFEEGNVEFDTGTHYIGSFDENVAKYWKLLAPNLEFLPIQNAYDRLVVGEKVDVTLRAGTFDFLCAMHYQFPNVAFEKFEKYEKIIRSTATSIRLQMFFRFKAVQPRWLGSLLVKLLLNYTDCSSFTDSTSTVLKRIFGAETMTVPLLNCLTAQWGDYGLTPNEAPFYMHACVVNHYLDGAYFPKNGAAEIAMNLADTIEVCGGGRVLVKAMVTNLCYESQSRKVCGVQVNNEMNPIFAPVVISDIGFEKTRQLLHDVPNSWQSVKARNSTSMVYLFASLDGFVEELKLPSYNLWSWPFADQKEHHEALELCSTTSRIPTFIAFPCAKDLNFIERAKHSNRSNVLVLSMAKYEDFEKWSKTTAHKHRTKDYTNAKKVWEKALLEELYRYFPQLKGKVLQCSVGSPLTFEHYIEAPKGQVYGLALDSWRFGEQAFDILRPETTVEGLWLTGQDIVTLGITSAFMSGVLTANTILKYGNVSHFDTWIGKQLCDEF